MIRSVIRGTGHSVPSKVLTNADLEKIVNTSDEWIVQRTGIKERRINDGPNESTGTLALASARQALERSGINSSDLDLIICATVSGDLPWPATACFIQDQLGATQAAAFDVSAACAGFVYAFATASAFLEAGRYKNALVIGADALTGQVNWEDRSTCVLFGDGAGAVVLEGQTGTDRGHIESVLRSDGSGAKFICIEVGGTRFPYGSPQAEDKISKISMSGAETFRFAVNAMGDACLAVLEKAGMSPDDVDLFVPHQANLRIIEKATQRIGLRPERVFVNVQKYGNTSAGSVPLALFEAEDEGRIKPGMVIMTVGFGAGLVWGANLIRW